MTTLPKITMGALIEAAYLEGWRKSLETYSVWKSGEQLTAMGRSARDEIRKAPSVCREEFLLWLERQKQAYGKDEG